MLGTKYERVKLIVSSFYLCHSYRAGVFRHTFSWWSRRTSGLRAGEGKQRVWFSVWYNRQNVQ